MLAGAFGADKRGLGMRATSCKGELEPRSPDRGVLEAKPAEALRQTQLYCPRDRAKSSSYLSGDGHFAERLRPRRRAISAFFTARAPRCRVASSSCTDVVGVGSSWVA